MQEDQKPSQPPYGKWRMFGLVSFITVKWIVYFGIFIGLLAGGAVTGYVAALVKDEEVRPQSVIQDKVGEYSMTGYVYFNDESLVGQLRTDEDRIVVEYEDIPQTVIDALLATEDNEFFEHKGVSINGLGRAVKQKLFNEDTQTGGSTLTQQLARRVFLSLDKTDSRKIKEIFLSLRMERYLTKEEILAAYLNKMPFGNGSNGYQVFGIKAAAKGIFGVDDLEQLNIAQSAYLAGLPQLPSLYNAFTGTGKFNEAGFERAVKRHELVLTRMLETGRITQTEYDEALKFDIRASIAPPSEKAYTTYPYLMLEAERQAAEALLMQEDPSLTKEELRKKENSDLIEQAREQLLRGGYHVYTTIDKQVYDIMRKIGSNAENFSPYNEQKGLEQTAAIMLDHKTGAIVGMLEGRDFYEEQMNFATQMIRQPGSTMKTLAAYLPAIDAGIIQPASIIDDAPLVLRDGQKGYHIPMNVNRKFAGLVTARDALNRSLNLPALKIFNEDVTIEKSWEFVRKLGITTLQPEDSYSQTGVIGGLRLGVSVEEMTNAYGAIPNQGVFNDAYMIERITDADGKIVYEHQDAPKQVFSEQTAFLMTDMLKTVISSTTGSGHAITKQFKKYGEIPIAGKTGSTQSYGDVWFMGFSPDVTLGVWAGYEEQINALSNNGRTRARSIWTMIMNEVAEQKPDLFPTEDFPKPDGIVKATVSSASGLLPSALTQQAGMVVTDWFNKEFVPKKQDDTLVNMKIITYNGINYVPNELTPEEFLIEKLLVKRKKPLDALMDEIQLAQEKLPSENRRPMDIYIPADAANDAPSKTDPRVDDGAVPAPPNAVKLTPDGAGNLTITFTDSQSVDVIGYRIYRSLNGGPYEKFGNSIIFGDPYTATFKANALESTSYYIVAVDIVGKESSPSVIVVSGQLPVIPEIPELPGMPGDGTEGGGQVTEGAPSAPSGVQAESSALSVNLSWSSNPVSDQVTTYHVFYSANNDGDYTLLGSTAQTNYEHVSPFATGTYYIVAENDVGKSQPSTKVKIAG
ncbi:transglycosylase domain-containing protein [Paenibacillus sp. strain BS8-2]